MGQDESTILDESVAPQTLSARNLSAVAEYIKGAGKRKIVVLTGAGISTAAGIPDFRSPKTGLYSNLARLNLPYAEAVFDIDYFRQHPEPFYVLAQELYPGRFHPTVSHAFIALLARRGLLQMLFTQNIDCLERRAGVPADRIVEAHGSFATQRCIECKKEFPDEDMHNHVTRGEVPHCADASCRGTVKPDIVFFGESLPRAFSEKSHHTAMADLVLIIGTSLTVYPFAGLPEMAREGMPRVLFNMERVGHLGSRADDVIQLGAIDDGIRKLADELGWRDELEELWRSLVGEEEAERQLRSQKRHEEEVEEEVQKLTEEVEAVLTFDESDTSDTNTKHGTSNDTTTDETQQSKGDDQSSRPEQSGPAVDKTEQHDNTAELPRRGEEPSEPTAITTGDARYEDEETAPQPPKMATAKDETHEDKDKPLLP
ncbi:SIR2 family histone deacetylase [Purpureocillium lavendulum]|uniref:NAD-dependent protein deacetylase n=1 Tax=Purpureocillium lavendulum TaxID=1247861 RepID=A0AB34G763_9HYPO|nr:SIR2 family histone deacetylase [Purpureocillium lavendulum]